MTLLLAWRKSQRLTAKKAGELIGVSHVQWHRMEKGTRKVASDRVLQVERLTGISRYDLRPDIFGEHPGRAA